jgi:hypothetical protein
MALVWLGLFPSHDDLILRSRAALRGVSKDGRECRRGLMVLPAMQSIIRRRRERLLTMRN